MFISKSGKTLQTKISKLGEMSLTVMLKGLASAVLSKMFPNYKTNFQKLVSIEQYRSKLPKIS